MTRKPMASRRKPAKTQVAWRDPMWVKGTVGVGLALTMAWVMVGWLGPSHPALTDASGSSANPATDLTEIETTGESIEWVTPTETTPSLGSTAALNTPPAEPERNWTTVTVRSGQSMDRIFKELGFSARLLHELVNLDEKTKRLVTIKPGDVFYFAFNEKGEFDALKGEYDEQNWLLVEQQANDDGSQLESTLEPRLIETRVVEASGVIENSLFNAAKKANLSDNMTMTLANVFGWDIDFALDIRKDDRFSLIYEEIWRDGQYLRDGPILAARFSNRGETFEAIRFDAGDGPDYFDPEGRRMRKAFLRAPLNFSRVTSNFNPRRFHPVTRQIRPHNGTDYGAAPGTPVWSAGDGVVIESAKNRVNGNYVFVQHGNHIVTRYLHLNRRDVKRGDRVSQGQTIGTVGSTGLATGPHLHYEFLVNGVHRDPRTVDLPPADPLPEIHRTAFAKHSQPLMARLDQFDDQARLLASMAPSSCEDNTESC